jgi:hypothetical protein
MKLTKEQIKIIEDNYRIITNGITYRVEKLSNCGMLFWKNKKWVPLCGGDSYMGYHIRDFPSKEHAIGAMKFCIKEDLAKKYGWEEVKIK